MTIPTSGPVSFDTLKNEYNDTNPVRLNEFYRGGLVPDSAANNGNVPRNGAISVSELRGSSNEFVAVISSPAEEVTASALFPSGAWASNVPKRIEINSGVTIGTTVTSRYAFTIDGGAGGTVRLNNRGSIQGASGAAGTGGNGGVGGNALRVQSPTTISNTGSIYAGGGGGGRGATGGGGCCPNPPNCSPYNRCRYACDGNRVCRCGPGEGVSACQPAVPVNNCVNVCCSGQSCSPRPCSPTSGGAGGPGGRGRGYTRTAQSGSAGSPGGGCGASSGSPGGAGGGWGTTGARGGGSGSPGGARGSYVVGDSQVTWSGGRGTVAGNVA